MTVLVTGATGTVGRHLVGHLLQVGQKVRALTRNPTTADLPHGVEVVAGDLTDVATLTPALDGVTAAHLITFGRGYQPLPNGHQIAELALQAGVGKVTILGGWQEGTLEPAVQASSLAWTYLQPIEFMANTLTDWGNRLRTDGVIREPYGDRTSAPVHEADIAAVAAVALTQDGHAGKTYTLTGPEVLTPRDKLRILSQVTGRDLRFEELTPDQTRTEWAAAGRRPPELLIFKVLAGNGEITPTELVEFLLHLYGSNPEVASIVTDSVQRVTGRPASTFAQWAADHAEDFRS